MCGCSRKPLWGEMEGALPGAHSSVSPHHCSPGFRACSLPFSAEFPLIHLHRAAEGHLKPRMACAIPWMKKWAPCYLQHEVYSPSSGPQRCFRICPLAASSPSYPVIPGSGHMHTSPFAEHFASFDASEVLTVLSPLDGFCGSNVAFKRIC